MNSIAKSDRWSHSLWIAVRRPLLVAAMSGCAASLMPSGRLTLRLVVPATSYWTFVPLLESPR